MRLTARPRAFGSAVERETTKVAAADANAHAALGARNAGEHAEDVTRSKLDRQRRTSREVARQRKYRQPRQPRARRTPQASTAIDDEISDEELERELGIAPRRQRGILGRPLKTLMANSKRRNKGIHMNIEEERQGYIPEFRPPPSRAEREEMIEKFLSRLATFQEIKRKKNALDSQIAEVFVDGASVDVTSAAAARSKAVSSKYKSERLARCPHCYGPSVWCPFHATKSHNEASKFESIPPPKVDIPKPDEDLISAGDAKDHMAPARSMQAPPSPPTVKKHNDLLLAHEQDMDEDVGEDSFFMSLDDFRNQLGLGLPQDK